MAESCHGNDHTGDPGNQGQVCEDNGIVIYADHELVFPFLIFLLLYISILTDGCLSFKKKVAGFEYPTTIFLSNIIILDKLTEIRLKQIILGEFYSCG